MAEIEKYLHDVAERKGISLYEVASMAMEVLKETFGTEKPAEKWQGGHVMSKVEFRERFMADMERLRVTA